MALLAQTCSQIGADSPNSKSLLPSLEGNKRKSSTSSDSLNMTTTSSDSNHSNKTQERDRDSVSRPRSSSGTPGFSTKPGAGKSSPAFKPYEASSSSISSTRREDSARKSPLESLQSQPPNQEQKPKTSSKRSASNSPNGDTPSGSNSSTSAKQPRKSPLVIESQEAVALRMMRNPNQNFIITTTREELPLSSDPD